MGDFTDMNEHIDIDYDMFRSAASSVDTVASRLANELIYGGGKIIADGVYRGVPIEAYHGDTELFDGFSISSSGLRQVIRRPSEYWAFSPYNPQPFPQEERSALEFGKAAHMLLLGEGGFAGRYVKRPDELEDKPWQSQRTVCRQWLANQKKAGKVVITETDITHIRNIKNSLERHPLIGNGLMNGRIERSIFHNDGGIWLKARPDIAPIDSGDFIDLKTASDLSYDGLSRSVFSNGYHVQAGLVRKVVRAVLGAEAFQSFSFVWVEKAPPYDVRIMQLKEDDIALGERQADKAIDTVRRCLDEGRWPGFDGFEQDVSFIEIPGWARTRIDTELRQEAA